MSLSPLLSPSPVMLWVAHSLYDQQRCGAEECTKGVKRAPRRVNPKKKSGDKALGSGAKLCRHWELCRALAGPEWPFLGERVAKSPHFSCSLLLNAESQRRAPSSLATSISAKLTTAAPLPLLPPSVPTRALTAPLPARGAL